MAVIKVPTNFNIEVDFEVPEFYRRLLSLAIDTLFLFFYYKIAIEILIAIFKNSNVFDGDRLYNIYGVLLLLILPILMYHAVSEILMNGQSFGKKIMGIRVVNENGGKPSISQFLVRWMIRDIWFFFLLIMGIQSLAQNEEKGEGGFMVVLALIYFITDIVLVVSSKKGQRIGDILAKTILIRINTKGNIEDTVFIDVADSYVPCFPQIMQLSDKDINAIKSILETAKKKNDYNMAESACYKIKSHLKIESTLPPFDFLDILLKDYNYLSTK